MERKIYKAKELEKFTIIVAQGKRRWAELCEREYQSNGDQGTCVLGAGIAVYCIPPRCRKPIEKILIHAHDVSRAQGSVTWEKSVYGIIDELRAKGLDCYYAQGRMD